MGAVLRGATLCFLTPRASQDLNVWPREEKSEGDEGKRKKKAEGKGFF